MPRAKRDTDVAELSAPLPAQSRRRLTGKSPHVDVLSAALEAADADVVLEEDVEVGPAVDPGVHCEEGPAVDPEEADDEDLFGSNDEADKGSGASVEAKVIGEAKARSHSQKKLLSSWKAATKVKAQDSSWTVLIKNQLKKLKGEDVTSLLQHVTSLQEAGAPHFTNSSGCSGSEVFMISGAEIAALISTATKDTFQWLSNGSAEKNPAKQDFIIGPVHKLLEQITGESFAAPCCFNKYEETGCKDAECRTHNTRCKTRVADFHWAGISCKTMSKLSATWKELGRTALRDKAGSSGETLLALLAHLDQHEPVIYIGENVEDVTKEENIQELEYCLGTRGYATRGEILKSFDFGSPQKRVRYWFISLNVKKLGITAPEAHTLLRKVFATINSMKVSCPSLQPFLLKAKDSYLKQELSRRVRAKTGEHQGPSSWKSLHQKECEGMPGGFRNCFPDATITESPWFKLMGNRESMALAKAITDHPKAISVDVYQSMNRVFIGTEKTVSTIVPGCHQWLTKHRRFLVGLEAMAIQGWDLERLRDVAAEFGTSDNIMRDMAGNAFTKGICNAVIVSLLVHLRIPSAVHVLPDDPARSAASAASALAAVDAVSSLEWTFE